jgi:rhodanese-related sulfurtransferase
MQYQSKIRGENMRTIITLALLRFLYGSALAQPTSPATTTIPIMNSSVLVPAEDFALLAQYADAFLSANNGTGGYRTIYAETLMDGVDDPAKADEMSDFYLLDLRKPADYAASHIAGAVNVQLGDLANPDVLAVLPIDRSILIICYTRHTASVATAILDLLGYDAWTLRFGMLSWMNSTTTAIWSPNVTQNITGGNYIFIAGPPGSNSEGC